MIERIKSTSFHFRYVFKKDKTLNDFLYWFQEEWKPIMVDFDINATDIFTPESQDSVLFGYVVETDKDEWDKKIKASAKMEIVMTRLNDIIDSTKTETYHLVTSRMLHLDVIKARRAQSAEN